MKRLSICTALMLCVSLCFGQISYKQGYFIDKQGNKTECLIKDVGWFISPTSITYRLTEGAQEQEVKTNTLSEFSLPGTKYISANVRYDQSSHAMKDLTVVSTPEWTEGEILLQVIVDGTAKLYMHASKINTLYFYSVKGSPIEQLEYKPYLQNSTARHTADILYNRIYMAQVNSNVRCPDQEPLTWRKLPYEQRALATQFRRFNTCSGDAPEKVVQTRKSVRIRLTPGIDYTSVKGNDANTGRDYEWGPKVFSRFGIDVEFALPFQGGKWSVVAEPNFFSIRG